MIVSACAAIYPSSVINASSQDESATIRAASRALAELTNARRLIKTLEAQRGQLEDKLNETEKEIGRLLTVIDRKTTENTELTRKLERALEREAELSKKVLELGIDLACAVDVGKTLEAEVTRLASELESERAKAKVASVNSNVRPKLWIWYIIAAGIVGVLIGMASQ